MHELLIKLFMIPTFNFEIIKIHLIEKISVVKLINCIDN